MKSSKNHSKRKKKTNSSSYSISITSPLEKKAKEKECSDDEVFQALDMAGHVAAKLDDITSKLDRLKSIEETIHNVAGSIKALEQKIEKVEENVKEIKQEQQVMDKSLETMNNEIQQLKNDRKRDEFGFQEETKSELNNLKTKLLYAEAYSRRENLKFIGIPELDDEDTEKVLLNFIDNHLEIESSPIEFQRVHRNGRKKQDAPRTIIARFLRYQDVEKILRQAKLLKNTPFVIYQDLPKEILDERKKLMGALKEAKRRGMKARFSKAEPDRLYIDGQLYLPGQTNLFSFNAP